MLNDDQILLKTAQLLENFDISGKKPEKLLREITEDEIEVIQDVLGDLKGEDLAFNELFDGKMRKVIDFPTMNNSTELGRFGEFFKKQDFDVDWEKGLVSAERDVSDPRLKDLVNNLMGGAPLPVKKKKIQMKVGKFFAKVADLSSKRDILYQKVYDYMNKIDYTGAYGKIDAPWKIKAKMLKPALDEKEYEDYNRIDTQIGLYIPNPGVAGPAGYALTDLATKYGEYWKTNAGYIKKEINKLDDDKYSMIITRHPIDVLRMSDFNEIYSCHSPPSRETQYTSFYKCAVAEAKGHGALAYVVETDDLLHMTGTSNIESAEQEIQEGEIFADEIRGSHVGLYHPDRALEPKSRIRLRQMRYYDTDEPKRWDEGTEVAVPVPSTYGAGIPGIFSRITDWARENQEKVIENMPKSEDDPQAINLDRFWIFGGTHADYPGPQGRRSILSRLIDKPQTDFQGEIRQNQDTEDEIDINLLGNMQLLWEAEVNEIEEEWNRQYAVTIVEPWVEDDGEGGLNIQARWSVVLDWSMDEFVGLPNSYPTGPDGAEHINELYGNIFDPQHAFLNKTTIDGQDKVRWGCRVNLHHPDVLNEEYFYDPDSLNEACQKIDVNIDDKRDAFTAMLEEFFKQNGWMEGGEYIKLAAEIEDGPFESYEWDVRYDGEHPTESYEATAAVSHDFDHEELGVNPEVLKKILESRDWRIAIRTALIASAQKALGTEYHLDVEKSEASISGSEHVGYLVDYEITFRITSDDPDERVKLFRELTTGEDSDMDDTDNLKAAFEGVMAQFLNARQPSHTQQNLDERLVRTWKEFLGR